MANNDENFLTKSFEIKIINSIIFYNAFEFDDPKTKSIKPIKITNGLVPVDVRLEITYDFPILKFLELLELYCFRNSYPIFSYLTYDNKKIVLPTLDENDINDSRFIDGSAFVNKLFSNAVFEEKENGINLLKWNVILSNGQFLSYKLKIKEKNNDLYFAEKPVKFISHSFDYKNATFSEIDRNIANEIFEIVKNDIIGSTFKSDDKFPFKLNDKFSDEMVLEKVFGMGAKDFEENFYNSIDKKERKNKNMKLKKDIKKSKDSAEENSFGFDMPMNIDTMFESMVQELYTTAKESGISDEDMEKYFKEYFEQFSKMTPGFPNNGEIFERLMSTLKNIQSKSKNTDKQATNKVKKDATLDANQDDDKEIN